MRASRGCAVLVDERAENLRRAGRIRTEWLRCDQGLVVDLSSTGMRVQSSRKPTAAMKVTATVMLRSIVGDLSVFARLVWTKKRSWRCFESGFVFVDLSAEQRATLMAVCKASAAQISELLPRS